jgi:hypothetical protein
MDRTPRSVNAIVESQVQRWLAERPRKTESYRPPPVITVSREFGSRGAALARVVADRLGFSYWNRELLAAIAAHARVDPSAMAPFDEHHPSALVNTVRGMMPAGGSATATPSQAVDRRAICDAASASEPRKRRRRRPRRLASAPAPMAPTAARVICGRKIEPYSASLKPRRSRSTVALAANDTWAMHCTKPAP